MKTFKINSGIPIPLADRHKYPFRTLQFGDSFFIPHRNIKQICAAAAGFSKRNPDYRFKCRSAKESKIKGVMVWRVEEKK